MPLRPANEKKDDSGQRKRSKRSKSSKSSKSSFADDHVRLPKTHSGVKGDEVVIKNKNSESSGRDRGISEDFESEMDPFTQDEEVYKDLEHPGNNEAFMNFSDTGAAGSVYGESDDEDQLHRELTSSIPYTPFLENSQSRQPQNEEMFNGFGTGDGSRSRLRKGKSQKKHKKKEKERGKGKGKGKGKEEEQEQEGEGEDYGGGLGGDREGEEDNNRYGSDGNGSDDGYERESENQETSRRPTPRKPQKPRKRQPPMNYRPPPPRPAASRNRPIGGFRNVEIDKDDNFFKEEGNEEQKISAEKAYLLEKLKTLQTRGEEVSQNFSMDSDINAMRLEYGRLLDRRQRDRTRTSVERNLNLVANAAEQFSKSRYVPKKLNSALEGLPQYVTQHIDEYEPFIDKISEQYGGFQIAQDQDPIVALVIQFCFHAGIFLFDRLVTVYVLNGGGPGGSSAPSASDVEDMVNARLTEEQKKWQKAMEEMQESYSREIRNLSEQMYDRPRDTTPPQFQSFNQPREPAPRDMNSNSGPTAQEMADAMYQERNKNGPKGVSAQLSANKNNGGGVFRDIDKLEDALKIQPI